MNLPDLVTQKVYLTIYNSRITNISSLSNITNFANNSVICSYVRIDDSTIGELERFLFKHGSTIVSIRFKNIQNEGVGSFNFSSLVLPARVFKIKSTREKAKFDPSFLISTNAGVLNGDTPQRLRDEIHIVIETVIDGPEFFPVFVDLSDTVKRFIYQYGPQNRNSKSFPVFYKEYDTLTDGKQGLVLFITSDNFGEHWPRKMLERMDRVHNLCIPKHLLQTVEFGSFGVDKFIADNVVTSQDCSSSTKVQGHEISEKCSNTWASQVCKKLRQG